MVFKRRNTSVLCNKMAETRVIHPREPLAPDRGKQANIRSVGLIRIIDFPTRFVATDGRVGLGVLLQIRYS